MKEMKLAKTWVVITWISLSLFGTLVYLKLKEISTSDSRTAYPELLKKVEWTTDGKNQTAEQKEITMRIAENKKNSNKTSAEFYLRIAWSLSLLGLLAYLKCEKNSHNES